MRRSAAWTARIWESKSSSRHTPCVGARSTSSTTCDARCTAASRPSACVTVSVTRSGRAPSSRATSEAAAPRVASGDQPARSVHGPQPSAAPPPASRPQPTVWRPRRPDSPSATRKTISSGRPSPSRSATSAPTPWPGSGRQSGIVVHSAPAAGEGAVCVEPAPHPIPTAALVPLCRRPSRRPARDGRRRRGLRARCRRRGSPPRASPGWPATPTSRRSPRRPRPARGRSGTRRRRRPLPRAPRAPADRRRRGRRRRSRRPRSRRRASRESASSRSTPPRRRPPTPFGDTRYEAPCGPTMRTSTPGRPLPSRSATATPAPCVPDDSQSGMGVKSVATVLASLRVARRATLPAAMACGQARRHAAASRCSAIRCARRGVTACA